MDQTNALFADRYGRTINYLRLSVTDRCNLRCFYCTFREPQGFLRHEDILSYEELLSLISMAQSLGVGKVRLTGGEPFLRKDSLWFLEQALHSFPEMDIRVTTNGTLLQGKVERLASMGLKHINLSLDTLNRDTFARITGRDAFPAVWETFEECLEQGLKVKLNVVAMRGVNDEELAAFLRLAMERPVDVRFIEFMPIGGDSSWREGFTWPADEILDSARKQVDLLPVTARREDSGPARMFGLKNGLGRVGVISPLSNHFCDQCNRFRITADGRLRTCLFSDKEYKLRPILRSSRLGLEQVLKVMRLAARKKPMGYTMLHRQTGSCSVCRKAMSSIGG
jgi:cyclic pyranopterin phosphate synthase